MDVQITEYTDEHRWLVQRGAARETFTDSVAMRRYVRVWRALRFLYPVADLDLITLAANGTITSWGLPGAAPTPAQLQAASDAYDAAQAQEEQDAQALRTLVRNAAQSAVGVGLTNLTAAQVRALLAILLHKEGALDKDGKVRPLADWAK